MPGKPRWKGAAVATATAALAGATLAGAAQAQAPDVEWALEQMRNTSIVFGSCVDTVKGFLPIFDEADCPLRDETHEFQGQPVRVRTVWFDAYPNAASLESDIAAFGKAGVHWAALEEGLTLGQVEAALPANMKMIDYLIGPETIWAQVATIGIIDSTDLVTTLPGLVRFAMPLTTKMSRSPLFILSALAAEEGGVAELVPGAAAQDLAARWAASIAGTSGRSRPCCVHFNATSRRVTADSVEAVDFLAAQPEVLWVSPMPTVELCNDDAAAMMQSGFEGLEEDRERDLADKMSVWKRGIRGQGQIVGVADAGLMVTHCMFTDDPVLDANNTQDRMAAGEGIFDYPDHRKVVQYAIADPAGPATSMDHGTHVSGTIAGSTTDPDTLGSLITSVNTSLAVLAASQQGMAPDAKLALLDIGDLGLGVLTITEAEQLVGPARDAGAFLHTNSWGGHSLFGVLVKSLDKYLFEHQDFAVLFAAGNILTPLFDGSDQATTIFDPGSAKNVITVGASQTTNRNFEPQPDFGLDRCFKDSPEAQCADSLAYFSSKGPTKDGRIKPDVVAPGYYVTSSIPSQEDLCTFGSGMGTSMATPVVAGTAALVRQWYTDGYFLNGVEDKDNGMPRPMGALIKASLIHSAETLGGFSVDDLDGARKIPLDGKPDPQEGFGRPMLENLMGADAETYVPPVIVGDADAMIRLKTGDSFTVNLTLAGDAAPSKLRATLVWYDAPASITAVRHLVNDLDLSIKGPAGQVVFSNGLAAPDRINSVEQIDVPASELSAGGRYVVTVSAVAVHVGTQPFALLVSGPIADYALEHHHSPSTPEGPPADGGGDNGDDDNGDEDDDDDDDDDDDALSTGAIAGIVAGAALLVFGLVGVLVLKPCGAEKEEDALAYTTNPKLGGV